MAKAGTYQAVPIAAHEGAEQAGQSKLSNQAAPLAAHYDSLRSVVIGSEYAQAKQQGPGTATQPGTLPHSGAATVTLAGKDGIGIIAGQALQAAAGDTLDIASGQNTHAAINGDFRIHSGQVIGWLAGAQGNGELKLTTANDNLAVQAQHDTLDLKAKTSPSYPTTPRSSLRHTRRCIWPWPGVRALPSKAGRLRLMRPVR